MLTDAPPHKANRAQFLESDQMKTLDLPKTGRLPSITKSIESAMKGGKGADVGQSTGSGRIGERDRECVIQCPMPLPLHILQLLLIHPKIVPQFMYESLTNLITHFGLA